MKSKCERQRPRCRHIPIMLVLSLAFGLSFARLDPARAQDGAQVPPPPRLKHRRADLPDPDFQSPLKQSSGQEFSGSPGNGEGGRSWAGGRRRRLEEFIEMRQQGGAGFQRGPGRFRQQEQEVPGQQGGMRQGGRRGINMGMGMGVGMGGGRRALDLTSLNLSEEQKQRIRQFRLGAREHARAAHQQLMQRQFALRNLLFSPDATPDQIRAARKELRQAQNRMDDVNLENLINIRGVLSAEQLQKLPGLLPQLSGRAGSGSASVGQRPNLAVDREGAPNR